MKKYIIYISMLVAASSSVMADNEDYRRENLQKRDFSGKSMQYAKLTYADASYANFIRTNLYAADLGTANLTGASFENANLTNANLGFATLKDASFSDATIKGANFGRTDITIFQLRSTRSYQNPVQLFVQFIIFLIDQPQHSFQILKHNITAPFIFLQAFLP